MGFVKTLKRKSLKIKNFFLKELSLKNKNIIISGSNSGIGLELTKKLLTENNILAFVNNETNNLDNLNNFNNLDIIKNNFEKNELEETSLKKINLFKPDILINCAASFGPEKQELKDINLKKFKQILNINVFGALQLINESLKSNNLKQIVNITSEMGSTANNKVGGYYYYRSSKSLLNSISKNLSLDLKNDNINVFCIHPGDVKTKMNSGGLIMPDISAKKNINILSENNSKFSGI